MPADPPPTDATGREELERTLRVLRTRIDAHFEAATQRTPESFACREGCSQCCHRRFGVFEVEAAPIREELGRMAARDPERRARIARQARDPAHAGICPFLVDDRCAIYPVRPAICRSHGLPVVTRGDDGAQRVTACPLNFTGRAPPRESYLVLDAINQPLAILAELWSPGANRVELASIASEPPEAD